MYLEIKSVNELAKWLRDNGITNKDWVSHKGNRRGGNPISVMTLHRILREKVYAGYVEHKKNGTIAKGEHQAIIPQELFDKAQEELQRNASGKSGRSNGSPNLLSGKIYNNRGTAFGNQRSVGKRNNNISYYATRGFYMPAADVDRLAVDVVREFLDSDLVSLPGAVAHILKQIDYENTPYFHQRLLIKTLINKAIYTTGKITFFVNLNPDDLQQFVSPNYMNQNTNAMKFVITGDAVIIDKPIIINKNIGSNKYTVGPHGLMTVNENNRLITMAFIQAQRVREIYERTGDGDAVLASEKISCTTFYRYLALAYLSPRVVNELMSGKINMPLRDIYEMVAKSQDFAEQERLFLGR